VTPCPLCHGAGEVEVKDHEWPCRGGGLLCPCNGHEVPCPECEDGEVEDEAVDEAA
jgi:RecJ-like exonuclease